MQGGSSGARWLRGVPLTFEIYDTAAESQAQRVARSKPSRSARSPSSGPVGRSVERPSFEALWGHPPRRGMGRSAGRAPRDRQSTLTPAQLRFAIGDVSAGQWDDVLALGELELENHVAVDPERGLRTCQIKLPHAAEALVVHCFSLVAVGEEALAPDPQRVRIMQSKNFDVGHEQPRSLDRGHHFRNAGDVAAREDVFLNPGVGITGRVATSDRMQQHHAIVFQQAPHMSEIFIVAGGADMLEHTDRDDAVERALDVAIVLQSEIDAIREVRVARTLRGDGLLLVRQRHPRHARAAGLREIEPHPAEPAADVERAMAFVDEQLGGDVALFRQLRLFEALARMLEIGARILPVGVQKEFVEPVVQIVMARDIAPRPGSIVALVEVTQRYPKLVQVDQPPWAAAQQQIAFAQLNHVVEIAVSDLEPSVHVEFAEREGRIEHYLPLGCPIRDANAEPGACAIAKGSDGSVCALDFEAAHADQLREEIRKQRTHVRPHTHASRAVRPATAADINLALKCRNEFKNLQYPILI